MKRQLFLFLLFSLTLVSSFGQDLSGVHLFFKGDSTAVEIPDSAYLGFTQYYGDTLEIVLETPPGVRYRVDYGRVMGEIPEFTDSSLVIQSRDSLETGDPTPGLVNGGMSTAPPYDLWQWDKLDLSYPEYYLGWYQVRVNGQKFRDFYLCCFNGVKGFQIEVVAPDSTSNQ